MDSGIGIIIRGEFSLICATRMDCCTASDHSVPQSVSGPARGPFAPGARNAQEAHQAIRQTGFGRTSESVACYLDRAASQLYGLIWLRALASQMAAARVE